MGSLSGGRWRRWWCTTQSKINQSEHEKGARGGESDPAPECRQEWSEARRRCSRWKRTDPPEIAGHKMLPIWRLNLWRVVLLFRLVAAAVVSLSPYIFPLIAGRTGLINGGSGTDVNHGPRPPFFRGWTGMVKARYNLPTATELHSDAMQGSKCKPMGGRRRANLGGVRTNPSL